MDNELEEIWKVHPLFLDYEGSNLGRVRRKETIRIKKQMFHKKSNRWLIVIYSNGKPFIQYTHRFICECFYGIKKNMTIDHIDSNPSNNCLANLRYLSLKDNINNPISKSKRNATKTTSKAKKVKCITLDGKEIGIFNSAKEAVETLKLSDNKRACNFITNVCSKLSCSAYGYKWEYVLDKPLVGEIFKKHPILNIEVSNLGRVKRGDNITIGSDNTQGYLKVGVNNKSYFVHRLIAETFIPNSDKNLEVNHINGNTKDNKVENLEWTTRQGNMMSEITHSKKSHKVDLYNLEGTFIKTFPSITSMCKEMRFDLKSVRMCLNGQCKQHHGYIFKDNAN